MKLTLMKDVRSMRMNPSFIRTAMYRLMCHVPSTSGLDSLKMIDTNIRRCPGCRTLKECLCIDSLSDNEISSCCYCWTEEELAFPNPLEESLLLISAHSPASY
jgi:hypothetical protein